MIVLTPPGKFKHFITFSKGKLMSKGNNKRGNKEARKPKQEKPKASGTADSSTAKPLNFGSVKKAK